MKFVKFIIAGISASAALALAAPAHAQDSDQQAVIERAEELGERIYLYDQAAWHTTDAMLEDLADPAAAGVRGWVVNAVAEADGGGHEAVFFREGQDGLEAAWSGRYDGRRVRDARTYDNGERPLTSEERAMAEALDAPFSIETDYSLCSERINRVVFPTGKADGSLYVYLLAPQPAMDQIPFGGHFRFEVLDGEVVDHRRFTNSCLTMALRAEEGQTPAALTISHLLDDTPTEIHVLSMLAARLPVYVMTTGNDRVWSVEARDGKPSIETVER
ncbi:hypothetical protein [uncultured Erythrobacter sp.]|uniref:hypothetical protein n=1 Tax=uncultured Erythrobacter sp. TaxID=263913 RepID=UPI00260F358D|nr:hypothetical protein [uncultured Erythrobacter sp.]